MNEKKAFAPLFFLFLVGLTPPTIIMNARKLLVVCAIALVVLLLFTASGDAAKKKKKINYYEKLEVAQDATTREIKKAYVTV